MPFKPTAAFLAMFFGLSALTGCGERAPSERTVLSGNDIGCYDKLGDRVSRYFDGAIENPEWQDTFECVNDQVKFFKRYVRGNAPNGSYDRADIAALIRKFLLVNRPVSDAFVSTLFEIKASVFGGSATVITSKEIDEFLTLSEILRKETTTLLPRLQAKHRAATGENLLALSDGLGVFGINLSTYLGSLRGTMDVQKETFIPFVREIITLHGGDGTVVDRYGDFVRNMKVVVSGGSPEVIEAKTWPILIREGAAFGGLLFAFRDMESASTDESIKNQFQIDLARRAQKTFDRVIKLHGAGIPLEVFDPVIDTIPFEGLSVDQREALKHDLRPAISKVLRGGSPGWLTSAAVGTLVDLFEDGMRRQIHLKRIYEDLGPKPEKKDFEVAARKYIGPAFAGKEREEVNSLIALAKTYIGLFDETSSMMLFTQATREMRSRNHMIRMSWFNLILKHAFSVYATGPEGSSGLKTARKEDLSQLSTDFYEILLKWKMALPGDSTLDVAEKRFREANLFMPISNGDSYMDEVEGTYYLAFLFSSGAFSGEIFRGVTENTRDWSACPIVGVDQVGQPAVSAECFRDRYFGHPEHFWKSFPGLQTAYGKMSVGRRAELMRSMETAARRGGYSEKPIGPFDIDSFAGLPHYVEDLVERFDVNDDEVLDKRELLDLAYPIFKATLAKAAPDAKSDFLLKGILTYIVKYGKAPKGTLSLLAWCARLPLTKVVADRASLYRVVALLSAPLELDKNESGSSWPVADANLFPTVAQPK